MHRPIYSDELKTIRAALHALEDALWKEHRTFGIATPPEDVQNHTQSYDKLHHAFAALESIERRPWTTAKR